MKKLNINVDGNKKLQNTDKVRFIIWNLPAVKTCPFRTAMCEKSCYARKAERLYPQVLPSRERNLEDSLSPDFVENMISTLEKELKTHKYTGKKVVFRVHESGDFYSQEYANKWLAIVRHFADNPQIVFLAYTKSIIFFPNYNSPDFPRNLVIRSSLWKDTGPEMVYNTALYHMPIYTALTAPEMEAERANGRNFARCDCRNCASCGMCWNGNIRDVICRIH